MKKFKFMALSLLASAFALTSCDMSSIKSAVKKIPYATEIYHKIVGTKQEVVSKVLSVKINSNVSLVTDETEPFKLVAKVEVEGSASKEVTWSSSDETVATVDAQGTVTPKAGGKTTITATSKADSSKKDSLELEVTTVPGIASVSIEGGDREVILHTEDLQLTAVVAAKGSAAKAVSWSSSDTDKATVDEFGVVSFVGAGEVVITATSKFDKTKSGSVTITVLDRGLHPELLEDGFEYSKSFPSQKLNAFLEKEAFSFEAPEGFYYLEQAAVAPDPEKEGDKGTPASCTIIAENTKANFIALDTAATTAEYFWYYNHLYYKYGIEMNCYIDPTQSFEFKVLEDLSDDDLLDISVSFTKDNWEPATPTEDTEWNTSVAESLTTMGVELPFVKLGAKYKGTYSSTYDELEITDSSVDFNKLNGYGAVLEEAHFEKINNNLYRKLLPDGTTYEFVQFYFCEDGNTIYVYKEAQFDALPVDAMKAYFASKGVDTSEMNIPLYSAASDEAYFTITILQDFYVINIFGSTKDEMDAYAALVNGTEGWSVKAGRYPGDYEADYGTEKFGPGMYIENWLEESIGAVRILCFVTEPPTFPSAAIAAALAELEITDTLPEFSGEAESYSFNASLLKLAIGVGEGNEEDGLATYKADLLTAHYTELGADEFGDMHYLSPNGQLDVCPWDGSLWGSDGYVIVDMKPYVAPAASFPVEEFNAGLAKGSFGFSLSAATAENLPGESFVYAEEIQYPDYNYGLEITVTIGGSYLNEYVAVFQPLLADAGIVINADYCSETQYTFCDDPDDPTYVCYIYTYGGSTFLDFTYYGFLD